MNNALLSSYGTSVTTEPKQLVGRWKKSFDGLLNAQAQAEEEILQVKSPLETIGGTYTLGNEEFIGRGWNVDFRLISKEKH